MGFPTLYPTKNFGANHSRAVKLTNAEYIKSRLLNVESRYRKKPVYVFFLLWEKDLRELKIGIYNTLRTCSQNMSAQAMLNMLNNVDRELEASLCTVLHSARGTKQFWFKRKGDVDCMNGQVLGQVDHFFGEKSTNYVVLLWIRDAPKMGQDKPEDVIAFIDRDEPSLIADDETAKEAFDRLIASNDNASFHHEKLQQMLQCRTLITEIDEARDACLVQPDEDVGPTVCCEAISAMQDVANLNIDTGLSLEERDAMLNADQRLTS
uniref:Helitron helicase-like domain-containing protein n=1 Tax=Amphimedon queenslandica TaxID=400682 RepID=A0A1X7ULX3_AMPQE